MQSGKGFHKAKTLGLVWEKLEGRLSAISQRYEAASQFIAGPSQVISHFQQVQVKS